MLLTAYYKCMFIDYPFYVTFVITELLLLRSFIHQVSEEEEENTMKDTYLKCQTY